MKIKKEKGLILAIDQTDPNEAFGLAKIARGFSGNVVLKFGRLTEMALGLKALSIVKAISDCPVIYDGKIADIPYISAKIARQAFLAGADAVIVHGFVGQDVIEEIVNLNKGDVIVVISMTHPGSTLIDRSVLELLQWAHYARAHGLVLPATKPDIIQAVAARPAVANIYIISPGIKTQGALPGDAIRAGADYEVVGRAITEAENPLKALEELYGLL